MTTTGWAITCAHIIHPAAIATPVSRRVGVRVPVAPPSVSHAPLHEYNKISGLKLVRRVDYSARELVRRPAAAEQLPEKKWIKDLWTPSSMIGCQPRDRDIPSACVIVPAKFGSFPATSTSPAKKISAKTWPRIAVIVLMGPADASWLDEADDTTEPSARPTAVSETVSAWMKARLMRDSLIDICVKGVWYRTLKTTYNPSKPMYCKLPSGWVHTAHVLTARGRSSSTK